MAAPLQPGGAFLDTIGPHARNDDGPRSRRPAPYFLWDEDVSIDELRAALRGGDAFQRDRLLGKMLREARDIDVWRFVTPQEVAAELPRLGRRLGNRRAFWEWLIDGWQRDGLL